MKGLLITENAMGFTAIRLHYTADPEKDPENPDPEAARRAQKWLDTQRIIYPDPNDWEREMEINFFVGKGTRVFPQFTQALHVRPLEFNKRKVIYRGWDFGWHAPVCLFAQIDAAGRLGFLREIVGSKKTTHEFATVVIERTNLWFPNHAAGFQDFCDPAGQQVKSIENERNERRDVEILSGLGIHPTYEFGWSRKDQRTLIHQLLALRSDGTPGFYVDEHGAPTLVQTLLGRYVYPETRDGRIKEDPDDETHPWADIVAAARYLVVGLHTKLGLSRFRLGQDIPYEDSDTDYHGYGTPTKR